MIQTRGLGRELGASESVTLHSAPATNDLRRRARTGRGFGGLGGRWPGNPRWPASRAGARTGLDPRPTRRVAEGERVPSDPGRTTTEAPARFPCRGTNRPSPPRPGHRRVVVPARRNPSKGQPSGRANRRAARISPVTCESQPSGQSLPRRFTSARISRHFGNSRDRQPDRSPLRIELPSQPAFQGPPVFPVQSRPPQPAPELPGPGPSFSSSPLIRILDTPGGCILLGPVCPQNRRAASGLAQRRRMKDSQISRSDRTT